MTRNVASGNGYSIGPSLDVLRRVWHLDHSLDRLSRRMEKRLGITARQRLALRCVGKFPGITAGKLADVLHVDPGTMSSTLDRLERKKLVQRYADPTDKRHVVIGLTARGRQLDRPMSGTAEHAVRRLLARTTPRRLAAFEAVLSALTTLLDEECQVPQP